VEGLQKTAEEVRGSVEEAQDDLQHDRKLLASNLVKILDDRCHEPDVLQDIVDLTAKLTDTNNGDSFDLRTYRHIFARWTRTLDAKISFRTITDFKSGHKLGSRTTKRWDLTYGRLHGVR
jgi:hypothetical protein